MTQVSLEQIKDLVAKYLAETPLAGFVRDVSVSLPDDARDTDLVRVTIAIAHSERIKTSDALDAIHRLEDVVMDTDGRFPSILFATAA